MNRQELEQALNKLDREKFDKLIKDFGGTFPTPESLVRAFVDNPQHERRLCDLLGLQTENEKLTTAAIKSATASKYSAIASCISALIALLAFLATLLANK